MDDNLEKIEKSPINISILNTIFIQNSSQKYIPIIKPNLTSSLINNLFTSIFPITSNDLTDINIIIQSLYSLFMEYPPLLLIIHSNIEKGFLFKQLIQLNIYLIDNKNTFEDKEQFIQLNNNTKKLIQLCLKYYDCPRKYYDLVYQKIASMTLWKKDGFDNTSFPPEVFNSYIELLQALYNANTNQINTLRLIPKKYIVMNGNTSIKFHSKTVKSISLKNRVFISWFSIPDYAFNEEDPSIFEIILKPPKDKNKKDNPQEKKNLGVYIQNETKKLYFKCGEKILFLPGGVNLQPTKWYLLKYSFAIGTLYLFDNFETKTYSLPTKHILEEDINLDDLILYKKFYGITTSSFIIKLPSNDVLPPHLFPGINLPKSDKDQSNVIKENALYMKFHKYGIFNQKIKDYFFSKINQQEIKFDLFISPFQIYYNEQSLLVFENNEISASFQQINKTELNYYNISDYNSNLKRINLLGGINVFLPFFEIIISSKDKYLETEEYICSILELIANVISKSKYNYIDAMKSHFFYCLSLFLETINCNLYNNKLWLKFVWIKQCFEELCETFPTDIKDNICKYNSYYNKIILNFNFCGKFNIEILSSLCKSIIQKIEQHKDSEIYSTSRRALLSAINLNNIIYYLLQIDHNKYTSYCCNEHKNMLVNPDNTIMVSQPSHQEIYFVFKEVITKVLCIDFLEQENNQYKNIILFFECLFLDISPCLQEFILAILDELFGNEGLIKDEIFIKCFREINLIESFIFLMSTSFYSVRIKVIEFINKHKELLLHLYNVICNDESLLILGLCLKPNLCRSIQRGSELKENDISIFNEEYKIEEKIFAKIHTINQIEEKKSFLFDNNFIFYNTHPEIKEDLINNYFQTCHSFFKSNFPQNKKAWFNSILLLLARFDKAFIQKEFPLLFELNESNIILNNDIISAEHLIISLLDISYNVHKEPNKDNNYDLLFPALYNGLCQTKMNDSFYQTFLIWFMYQLSVVNSIKDEFKEEKKEKMSSLFDFFEVNILTQFLSDFSFSSNSSPKMEVIKYFMNICYDYIFTLKHNIDFISKDEEICHLMLPDKKEKLILFEKSSDKTSSESANKIKEQFEFDIPKFLMEYDEHKIKSIENVLFPFCKLITAELQLNDLSLNDNDKTIQYIYDELKKNPKKKDITFIKDILNLLFLPPHLIKEEEKKSEPKSENINENKKEILIDLTKYQFTEGCRIITISLHYYIKFYKDLKRKINVCKLARDFIIYICGYIIKYYLHKNLFENYSFESEMLNLARNSVFILFKSMLQVLYPSEISKEFNDDDKRKLKHYIASLIYFHELVFHHSKCKELTFLFSIFENFIREGNSFIKVNELGSKQKRQFAMILNSIQDKNEGTPDTFWNMLLGSVPAVNEQNQLNYFQKNTIAHNARKLIYEMQYLIPIILPVEIDKLDKSKIEMLSIHYDTNYISYQHYHKLYNYQAIIQSHKEKELLSLYDLKNELDIKKQKTINLYKSIKKHLFSFRNSWSNHKLFYEEQDKLKYKITNHYSSDFSQCLLTPIIDIDYYLPQFKSFSKETLFLENNQIINLNIGSLFSKDNNALLPLNNQSNTYLVNLYENFKKLDFTNIPKKNNKTTVYYLCLVKKTCHIRCMFDIDKQKQAIRIMFIHNNKKLGIDETDILYDKDNNKCFGSFIDNYPKNIYKPFLKIPYENFAFYLDRNYYYKDAIEIFTTQNKSFLFHGNSNAISQLKSIIHEKLPSLIQIKISSKDNETIGYSSNNISNKFFTDNKCICFEDILNKWKNNKISSFNFLLICNIFGGRSFNDLTQYPVFPWTLNTYSNSSLNYDKDLRNFEFPMGKLGDPDSSRFQLYQKEYEDMLTQKANKNDDNKETLWETIDNEPYFYETHYSNLNNVSNFLSRIFPFTLINIEFLGKNEEQSKEFISIPQTFQNVTSLKNDLSELIPEFFILPEIFRNINKLTINSNKPNVELPKWANNHYYEFIKKHRMSLESEECQKVLHHWIDLIFGYKQIGEQAKIAHNLFMNHTYWKKISIKEDNRTNLNANDETWINHYLKAVEKGLTPRQLLKEENTSKLTNKKEYKMLEKSNIQNDKWFFIEQSLTFDPIVYCYYENAKHQRVYVLTKSMKLFKLELTNEKNSFFHIKQTFNLNEYIGQNQRYNFSKDSNKHKIDINRRLININYWDKSIHEYDFSGKHIKSQSIICKEDNSLITSFILAYDNTIAIIGTQKGSLIIYDLATESETFRKKNFFKKNSFKSTNQQRKWKCISLINDHYSEITAISIKEELNILVSCDKEGYVNIYTVPKFKFVRSFKLKSYTEYIFISDTPLPCIVTFANKEFQSFTLNGSNIQIDNFDKLLLRCPIREEGSQKEDINAFCYYRHHTWNEILIVATTYGHLQLRTFPEMKILQSIPIPNYKKDDISGLFVLNERIIVVVTVEGKVHILTDEK